MQTHANTNGSRTPFGNINERPTLEVENPGERGTKKQKNATVRATRRPSSSRAHVCENRKSCKLKYTISDLLYTYDSEDILYLLYIAWYDRPYMSTMSLYS